MTALRHPALSRAGRVLGRALVRGCARRMTPIPEGFPATLSFTFDDFPGSALDAALPILEAAGMKATWYASGSLLDRPGPCGGGASRAGLARLAAAGHEIGNHTLRHLDARAVAAADYGRDIDDNGRALAELLPGVAVRSFSYPFGGVTVAAKRAAMARAASCRSTMAGTARGAVDLALLPANPLYGGAAPLASARGIIGRLRSEGGWAIFYTHDVRERPSPWGCTPASFAAVVAAAVRAGLRVETVGSVTDRLIGGRA